VAGSVSTRNGGVQHHKALLFCEEERRNSAQAGASAGNFAEKSGPEQIYGRPEKQTRDSGANQGGLPGEWSC
jgi:hypothetical protein